MEIIHNHDLGYSAEAGQLVEMLDFRSLPQIRKKIVKTQ